MEGIIDALLKQVSPDDDTDTFDRSKTIQNIKVVVEDASTTRNARILYAMRNSRSTIPAMRTGSPPNFRYVPLDLRQKPRHYAFGQWKRETVELAACYGSGRPDYFLLSVNDDEERFYAEQSVDKQMELRNTVP